MPRHNHKTVLANFTFRADPDFLDMFIQDCHKKNITRSEGFREIFNKYILENFQQKLVFNNQNIKSL